MSNISYEKECVAFTRGVISALNDNGFFVNSTQEAFYCILSILRKQVYTDMYDSVKEIDTNNNKSKIN